MKQMVYLVIIGCALAQTASAQWQLTESQKREIAALTNMPPQMREQYTMIAYLHGGSLAYRGAVIQKMLEEANYFADRLNLPTKRPIQVTDVRYPGVSQPWFDVIRDEHTIPYAIVSDYGTNIFNASIPREARLRALKFGARGTFDADTNFVFCFSDGKLWEVLRLSEHDIEYYAHDLDKLVGKPSLIDTNGAYQLATQWLAAVDVNMAALEKLKWTAHQLHYLARGATNAVALPLYYVDFGSKHFPAAGPNLKDFDEPLVSVEVLGTTKELQDLTMNDTSLSQRPLMLITNALELIRTPNPPVKRLESTPENSKTSLN